MASTSREGAVMAISTSWRARLPRPIRLMGSSTMKWRLISVLSLAVAAAWLAGIVVLAQQEPPTFRGGINLVSLNVVVKDGKGRTIRDLQGGDFEVLDQGRAVRLTDFRVDDDPVSLAV